MPAKTHKDELLDHFDRIESEREDLFHDLDSLSDEQLHYQKAPGKWNILQILDHLMTSEKLSLSYIERKTRTPEGIERSGFRSKFRIYLLRLAFVLPFKYKAPKISDATGKKPKYDEVKSEWEQIRQGIRKQIINLEENILISEILKHPIVGMLNMKQTLDFFEIHFGHHRKQILDIIELTSSG